MSRVIPSPEAHADLDEVGGLRARDSLGAADRFIEHLTDRCRVQAMDSRPFDRETGSFGFAEYVVYYHATPSGIALDRILPTRCLPKR